MILGTAGHIDHGKTALVRALTGVDTDRLPEEKRRGITIDLGFAPLRLTNGTVLGVVDVPGHEAFVRTMLAGATGIDLALIVIAADEGPMPQTREHLAILQLLDVRHAIVALTKSDLVEEDWLALVTEDVRALLASTRFADAEIIPTSVVTEQGLDRLRDALGRAAQTSNPKPQTDLFRLPVDRAFSVKGTGTVVTGTVWSGTLSIDDTVRIMPLGATARVRGLQSHGAAVSRIAPGMRAAIALAGVEQAVVGRGSTLVIHDSWEPTLVVRADLTLLAEAPELRPRTKVRFHLATSDVGARVVATGSPVAPGSSRPVRIVLDEPVMARAGDRFVLRSASPLATIGGGVITDSNAPRRARPMPELSLPLASRFALLLREAGAHGVPDSTLGVRLGVAWAPGTQGIATGDNAAIRITDSWYASSLLDELRARLLELVRAHHAQHPLDTGAPRQDVRSRLSVEPAVFDQLVSTLVDSRALEATGAELRVAGRAPELSDKQSKVTDDLLAVIEAAGSEPPSVTELQTRFGPQTLSLLRHLERQKRVVQVEDARYYAPDAVRELLRRLEGGMAGKGEVAPTDLRDVLGFSRKYLIPFLEYCDRQGYTARQGNGRIWRGAPKG
jgi:selenocysteine-specific elongation factor